MLPASDIAEIISSLASLKLEPTTTAAVLGAVLAPLLRSSDPNPPALPRERTERLRPKPRKARQQKRKNPRPRVTATPAGEPKDAPRRRAIAALKANPGASLTAVAKLAGVSRSTVVNASADLAAEARKQARREARKARENPVLAKQTERRARAQQFLRGELAHGPKRVSDVEEAAEKAHVDLTTLAQARGDLGIVASRANAGGVQAVQWSMPG